MAYPNKFTDAQVEILGETGAAKRLSINSTSETERVALTATTRRVSIKAVGADANYKFGGSTVTASSPTSANYDSNNVCHYIADGERLDFACSEGTYIAAIAISGTGVIEITELV